ncbi:UNVERIFIED_CONTAM: hypothetical protein GTU68_049803, partial [Idotea baltica]|nr:hypothetical protein [Idotea baltica]
WSESIKRRVKLNLRLANYPPGFDDKTWRNLFRTCASIRLFLPSLLSEVDSLIYVDTDVVFLATLESLWSHMGRMNSSHMAGLSPEHEDAATGWYNRFAKHPYYGRLGEYFVAYYGRLGVNSGVMLMNLTRLRAFGWEEYLVPIEKEFHAKLSWGDQDIINIIFHYHPDKLYLFGCQFNYRPDHCMYTSTCKDVADTGVFALHGSRRTFHTEKQPVFKAVYETWSKVSWCLPMFFFFFWALIKLVGLT